MKTKLTSVIFALLLAGCASGPVAEVSTRRTVENRVKECLSQAPATFYYWRKTAALMDDLAGGKLTLVTGRKTNLSADSVLTPDFVRLVVEPVAEDYVTGQFAARDCAAARAAFSSVFAHYDRGYKIGDTAGNRALVGEIGKGIGDATQ